MPHITIEYSANIGEAHDIDALVAAVHGAALDHGLPPADGLRTRAGERTDYRIADGSSDLAFVAIVVRIGPGRNAAAKTSFIETILDAAEAELDAQKAGLATEPATTLAIAWSIELHEIDPDFRINRNHVRTRLADRESATESASAPAS